MTMTAEEVLANGNTNLIYTYPNMTKTMRSKTGKQFKLHVEEGQFADSEILVLLGELCMRFSLACQVDSRWIVGGCYLSSTWTVGCILTVG